MIRIFLIDPERRFVDTLGPVLERTGHMIVVVSTRDAVADWLKSKSFQCHHFGHIGQSSLRLGVARQHSRSDLQCFTQTADHMYIGCISGTTDESSSRTEGMPPGNRP